MAEKIQLYTNGKSETPTNYLSRLIKPTFIQRKPERRKDDYKSKKRQYITAFVSSLSAFCAGASFVWVTPLLVRLQKPDAEVYLTHEDASWVVSLIEVGNFFSPIPGAIICDKIGRKPVLLATGPIYVVTWLLVIAVYNVSALYIMRLTQGMAMGVIYAILPIYLGEIASPSMRGTISVFFIAMWFLGILAVYCVGPFVSYAALNWFCLIHPIVFTATFWYYPESPHFLLMRGRDREAVEALRWLRGQDKFGDVKEELETIELMVQQENKENASWLDLFKTKQGRKSFILVQVVALTQLLAGYTAVLSYATDTLTKEGDVLLDPDICTILIGSVTMVVTLVTGGLVDKTGRRPIFIISGSSCTILLAITSIYYYLVDKTDIDVTLYQWIPYLTLISFVTMMNFGLSALLPTLQAELFPNSTRGLASGITTLVLSIASFILLRIYIPIQDAEGIYLNYVIYTVFCLLGTILIYSFLPETKGKTFQAIQDLL